MKLSPGAAQFVGPCANVSHFLRFLSHLRYVTDRELHSLIVFQQIEMPVHKFPVEGREWAGIVPDAFLLVKTTA